MSVGIVMVSGVYERENTKIYYLTYLKFHCRYSVNESSLGTSGSLKKVLWWAA